MPAADALAALGAAETGLTQAEADRRLAKHGPNRVDPPAPTSAWRVLLAQLTSVIVYLLIAAIAVALAFGDHVEAAAIAAVLVINTALGFVTEIRARRAMEALINLDVPRALVLRDGGLRTIDASALVPGDVIDLEAGRQVPADARLLAATDLAVDEAPLTGESLPISKSAEAEVTAEAPLAERPTMVYKGTTVSAGIGRAVVTATGVSTEVGRIGVLTSGITLEPTPLERRLDALGRRLVWLTLAIAALVAGLGLAQGRPVGLVVETAIALAIAAVPEALPAVATIALAVGVHRMARRHALVRRLPAVETLGSVTVVCTDKTRTLTSGEMTVVRVWAAGHDVALDRVPPEARSAVQALLASAAAASRRQAASAGDGERGGDPVDLAMIAAAETIEASGAGADGTPAGVVPFSSERRLMAVFLRSEDGLVAHAKGAPRAILDISASAAGPPGPRRLDAAGRDEMVAVNDALAADGLRVIAVARGPADAASPEALRGLTMLGFVGLADPPAPGVKETIGRLKTAGLRTVMLTGDQRLTAEAVGRALGVLEADARAMNGADLDAMSEEARARAIPAQTAFSRISPEHKLTVVRALQARGEIVAMFGDGVNDAAALKQADVGVAMGVRGTDAAKQSAAIVLQDDRFETIAAAVEEGRVIFDNIRKFVFYLFSCNVAEVLALLGAAIAGLPLPLLPLQLLWLNLVTDTFPALALAMEPADTDVMARPPRRPDEALLSGAFLGRILFYAALITAATLGAFVWALDAAPDRAGTVAFMTLALAQTAHLGNARSESAVLRPRRALANPYAIGAVLLTVALQLLAILFTPLADLLQLTPLGTTEWLVCAGGAIAPAVIGQTVAVIRGRP
jgi:Ca2+-transporting ATPase